MHWNSLASRLTNSRTHSKRCLPMPMLMRGWRENYPKDPADIAAHNERLLQAGPRSEREWAFVKKMLGHTDAKTWFEFAVIDDEKTFAI